MSSGTTKRSIGAQVLPELRTLYADLNHVVSRDQNRPTITDSIPWRLHCTLCLIQKTIETLDKSINFDMITYRHISICSPGTNGDQPAAGKPSNGNA